MNSLHHKDFPGTIRAWARVWLRHYIGLPVVHSSPVQHNYITYLLAGGVDSARKSRGKESKTGRQAADQPMDSPVASTVETENPLLGPLEEEDGKPCMGGNTSLVHLNLACE